MPFLAMATVVVVELPPPPNSVPMNTFPILSAAVSYMLAASNSSSMTE